MNVISLSCKTGKKCVTKLHNNNLFYIYYYGAYVFFPRTFPFLYFSFLLSCVVFFLLFLAVPLGVSLYLRAYLVRVDILESKVKGIFKSL